MWCEVKSGFWGGVTLWLLKCYEFSDRLLKLRNEVKSMNDFSIFTISSRQTIREAFKKQGLNKEKFVIVIDSDNRVTGIVTDGDFRRAVWDSVSLEDPVDTISNKNFMSLPDNNDIDKIKKIFSTTNIRQIPILKDGILVDIILRKDFHEYESKSSKARLNIPVVIMAGGAGARLDPFTRILPKPLIPIGEKPVIEIIIEKFAAYGATHFYVSVNHRAKMIKAFFEDFAMKYNISYLEEEKPLGTAGALRFLKGKIKSPFIVSNCDIIIEEDYTKILEFHKKGGYLLTLVGSMQHHIIPYGVCRIKNGGQLSDLKEKPEYDFLVNTGMYIVDPDALKVIPDGKKFDITEFINKLKQSRGKIGVYPISEKSWIDIGQWEEYKKTVEKLQSSR